MTLVNTVKRCSPNDILPKLLCLFASLACGLCGYNWNARASSCLLRRHSSCSRSATRAAVGGHDCTLLRHAAHQAWQCVSDDRARLGVKQSSCESGNSVKQGAGQSSAHRQQAQQRAPPQVLQWKAAPEAGGRCTQRAYHAGGCTFEFIQCQMQHLLSVGKPMRP